MGASAPGFGLGTLPGNLPIFPLAGVILLPRAHLPLNIFEPRYLAMVQDVLATPSRLIGMIQPIDPADRSRSPAVYRTGCAGRIGAFEETEDGRYLITLTGICRFDLREELAGQRGYRVVVPDWQRFAGDLAADPEPERGSPRIDRRHLIGRLEAYFARQGVSANWENIARTPDERLINTLAMICPFEPAEKQALLEAETLDERARRLNALIEMAVLAGRNDDSVVPQ